MRRDFSLRLEEVDNILNEMTVRGIEYLDATLRFGRIVDLFRQQALQRRIRARRGRRCPRAASIASPRS